MTPYGCHSKPRLEGYWGRQTAFLGSRGNNDYAPEDGWTWIPDTMTKTCQYRKDQPTDPRCEGCTCD